MKRQFGTGSKFQHYFHSPTNTIWMPMSGFFEIRKFDDWKSKIKLGLKYKCTGTLSFSDDNKTAVSHYNVSSKRSIVQVINCDNLSVIEEIDFNRKLVFSGSYKGKLYVADEQLFSYCYATQDMVKLIDRFDGWIEFGQIYGDSILLITRIGKKSLIYSYNILTGHSQCIDTGATRIIGFDVSNDELLVVQSQPVNLSDTSMDHVKKLVCINLASMHQEILMEVQLDQWCSKDCVSWSEKGTYYAVLFNTRILIFQRNHKLIHVVLSKSPSSVVWLGSTGWLAIGGERSILKFPEFNNNVIIESERNALG